MGKKQRQEYCPHHQSLVLAERQTPNHILHLLLSLVTMGAWIIVWLLISAVPSAYRCPMCGEKTKPLWLAKKKGWG